MHVAAALRVTCLPAWLLLGCAGCHRQAPVDAEPASAVAVLAGTGQIQWRGMGGCADCDGIDSNLTLRRSAAGRDYTLVETYYIRQRGIRFAEHGRWRQAADLVQLAGDGGSRRVYALLPDGRLQARGAHGAMLPAGAALVPVSMSDAP